MKNGIAPSTPKKLVVKPTALGILLDAKGAVGGLARAYTTRDDLCADPIIIRNLRREGSDPPEASGRPAGGLSPPIGSRPWYPRALGTRGWKTTATAQAES